MEKIKYISTGKYADMMGKSRPAVTKMINQGRIPGAVMVMFHGRPAWAIPENTPWPDSNRNAWDRVDMTALVEAKLAKTKKKPGPKPKAKE